MKEKEKEEQVPSGDVNSANDNRLEAVRDLLFGPNDQEYRKEFKALKDGIDKNQADLDDTSQEIKTDFAERLEKLESKLTEHIASSEAKLSKAIEELNDGKADRKQLAKLLQNIAKELES